MDKENYEIKAIVPPEGNIELLKEILAQNRLILETLCNPRLCVHPGQVMPVGKNFLRKKDEAKA